MASEKQIDANRANAKNSTGPRSVAGQARSRLNSRMPDPVNLAPGASMVPTDLRIARRGPLSVRVSACTAECSSSAAIGTKQSVNSIDRELLQPSVTFW